jgi:hypothetical protein
MFAMNSSCSATGGELPWACCGREDACPEFVMDLTRTVPTSEECSGEASPDFTSVVYHMYLLQTVCWL